MICNFFLLCYNSQIKGPSPMYFFLSAGKWLKGVWCKISNKRSEKKVLTAKKTIFWIFWPYSSILGPKNSPSSYKGGLFWQVRMDMVLGNLHAKFGTHSSSSLVTIVAQTEICQKVAIFFVIFWQFFEDFSYFPLSQSNKTLKSSNHSPG